MSKYRNHIFGLLFLFVLSTSSCASYNMMQTEKNVFVDSLESIPVSDRYNRSFSQAYVSAESKLDVDSKSLEYIIRADDKLSMSIWDHPDLSVGTVFDSRASTNTTDRFIVVSEQGIALFPKLGAVQVEGLSTKEVETELIRQYSEIIVDPQVIIRVENLELTILGAVNSPGNYKMAKKTFSLAEVIGMAGGLEKFADTHQLKLVRNDESFVIDLTQNDPSYLKNLNLYSGDIVYVPYNKSKNLTNRSPGIIAVTSVVSTAILLISVFSN